MLATICLSPYHWGAMYCERTIEGGLVTCTVCQRNLPFGLKHLATPAIA